MTLRPPAWYDGLMDRDIRRLLKRSVSNPARGAASAKGSILVMNTNPRASGEPVRPVTSV